MYVAYSAIRASDTNELSAMNEQAPMTYEIMLRYEAYQTVCNKLSREIEAIQKYNPGWMPKFQR
jgi:hypothetical protein